jgi:hypothetical protein
MQSQPFRRDHNAYIIPCTYRGCSRWFRNQSGLTQHLNTPLAHASLPRRSPAPAQVHPLPETDPLSPDGGYEVEPQHPVMALSEESDSYTIPDDSQPEHLPPPEPVSSSAPQEPRARMRDYHEELNGK